MKKLEAYPLVANPKEDTFMFVSEGPKGTIQKIIEFSPLPASRWNLAFGDITDDDWMDNIISDNDDMRKVLQTVANAVHVFTLRYPERVVHIEPLDRKRKILYNRIFQQKQNEIEDDFIVSGIVIDEGGTEKSIEPYDSQKMYDTFLLTRK